MPLFAALPLAVAAVVVAKIWRGRRDGPLADLEAQNQELRNELAAMQRELLEAQERLDFTERVLTQQSRSEQVRGEQVRGEQVRGEQVRGEQVRADRLPAPGDG